MIDTPALPNPTDWHTEAQVLIARPYLNSRTIKTLRGKGLLRYSKRGAGKTAMCLYKLADIDATMDLFVVEPTHAKADA